MAVVDPTKSTALPKFNSRSPNLAGLKFDRLEVLAFAGRSKQLWTLWRCKCACGNEAIASTYALKSGGKRSCGCLGRDITSKRSITHGMTRSPEFRCWKAMRERCYRRNATGYKNWGGRGITVCERWRDSFENFYADMGPRPSPKHSLDRYPDNDGNYEPGNVRWATFNQQASNRRKNATLGVRSNSVWIEYRGTRVILADLVREFGADYLLVHSRLRRGWDVYAAMTTPKLR
jgi:hypothetical protein